jgi:hypothetical protein
MRRLSIVVFVLAMLVGMGSMNSVVARGETPETIQQEATPQVGTLTFPMEPDPLLCTIEPRSTEDLLGLWFSEDGTPVTITQEVPDEVTIPLGPAADDEEISAIYATVHELFSCFAAGDFPRATSLFTDDLARQFGPGPEATEEEVTAFLEAEPVPETGVGSLIIAITDVMELEDGRVGAFVVDRGVQGDTTAYVIFEQDGDRWLVDEVIEFSTGEE